MNQPLAYVHPQAKVARNVVIEPFTTIHANVIIGSGTWIGSNVTIMEGARIGKNCRIFPGSVISAIPQDLKYDNEDTEVFNSFMKRIDDLNDTSEYDKEFGTKDGFGAGEKEDDTYELLKTNSEKYKKHKYDMPDEYQDTPRVRVTTKESKNDKMKRLNFKNEFKTENDMKELIPEHYKSDGHVFLMDDGIQTFKVRWDEELNEGTVLSYKNKTMITEDTKKMKKL